MFADVYDPTGTVTALDINYPVKVDTVAPANPWKGLAWMDSGTGVLSVWDGTTWVQISGGGAAGPALPVATQVDQILKAMGPTLAWTPTKVIDSGRY